MKKSFIASILYLLLLTNPAVSENSKNKSAVPFREVWAYMMREEERFFTGNEPVTDVFYFSCAVNFKGRLNLNVERPILRGSSLKQRRIHLVITELSNTALSHFALNPKYDVRDKLIEDIINVSEKFDGIQIDFESVSAEDGENFLFFLEVLKSKLKPEKILSVALPARRRYVADAYDYKKISAIVDRVFIMTYDEHWSTSKPGPVASFSWCRDVVKYAGSNIPAGKLVMGIPFYGRSWQDKSYNKAVKSRNLIDIIKDKTTGHEYSDEHGSKIIYRDSVDVTVYCDDINSIRKKLLLFSQYVDSVGFWRLGFEIGNFWDELEIINTIAEQ